MSFNEDQYSPNRPNSHRKNNRVLIVGAENKASRPTVFQNPNTVEAPKGYHVMPGGNLMSDALHKMMCGGEHKKLPKAMFGMITKDETPEERAARLAREKRTLDWLRANNTRPKNFDKYGIRDNTKQARIRTSDNMLIVPDGGNYDFTDVDKKTGELLYPLVDTGGIDTLPIHNVNGNIVVADPGFMERYGKTYSRKRKGGDLYIDYVNPELETFADGGEVMELTDDEIQKLKDGGAHIVELEQMPDGGVPASLKKQLQNYTKKWEKTRWGDFTPTEHNRKLKQAMAEYKKIEGAPSLEELEAVKFDGTSSKFDDYGFAGPLYGMDEIDPQTGQVLVSYGWIPQFHFDRPIEDVAEKLPTKKFDPIPEPQIIPRENKPVPPIKPEELAYRTQTIIDEKGNYKVVTVPYAANDGHGWNSLDTPRVIDKRKGKFKIIDAPRFGDGGEVMELTDEEIQKLRDGGAVVMELDLKKKDDALESMANGDEKKKKKQTAVVSPEGVVKSVYSKEPFDINYRQLGPQEATWTLPGPYASEELKSQEEFVSDTFNKYGEVAKPYTVEFDELVVYPTDELKGKQEKLIKSYEDTFKKLWQYGAHEGLGLPKSNRIKDLEKWNKDASAKVKELDQRHTKTKADVEKIRKKLGYENAEDVLSVNGLNDFRKLYKDKKISSSEFMSAYENYLKYYDPNMVTLSKEDRQELENIWNGPVDDQGRRRWMGKPRNVTKVGAGVALAAVMPPVLANPLVQAGLTGYGIYDAATNRLPQAYQDFSEGNYREGFFNLGSAALDLVPGMVFDDMYRAGKAIKDPIKNLSKGMSTRAAFQTPQERLMDVDLYRQLTGGKSAPGLRNRLYEVLDQRSLVKMNKADHKAKRAIWDNPNLTDEQKAEAIDKVLGQQWKNLENFETRQFNRRLNYSGLPIKPTGMGGGQGSIYENLLNPNELIKIGSWHGTPTDMRELIKVGENFNVPGIQAAFPTKALVTSQNLDATSGIQFMPKLSGKTFNRYESTPQINAKVLEGIKELDARNIGVDFTGQGNIMFDPTTGTPQFVDLTYIGQNSPWRRSSIYQMDRPPEWRALSRYGISPQNLADGGEVMELTDEEIQKLREGGAIVIES